MPRVEFEPTIPVFEWTKTVHALDRAATVIGICWNYEIKFQGASVHNKLTFAHSVKKFPTIYETQWFITMFTRTHRLCLSWARWI
jgi:hypothetical protein